MTDRDAILRRRARFLAAALAVVPAVEGCAKETVPASPPIPTAHVPEADAAGSEETDGGELVTEVSDASSATDVGEAPPEHPPSVCLSPAQPSPHVCLWIPAPNPKPKPRICLDFN